MTSIQDYLSPIVTGRDWSWSLIAMAYLIPAFWLRSLFFRSLLRELKAVDPTLYAETLKLYLSRSLPGWILFLLSPSGIAVLWFISRKIPLSRVEWLLTGMSALILLLLSILLHFQVLSKALLAILRQRTGIEKEF